MLFLCDQDEEEHSNDESLPSPASTFSNENSESSEYSAFMKNLQSMN